MSEATGHPGGVVSVHRNQAAGKETRDRTKVEKLLKTTSMEEVSDIIYITLKQQNKTTWQIFTKATSLDGTFATHGWTKKQKRYTTGGMRRSDRRLEFTELATLVTDRDIRGCNV